MFSPNISRKKESRKREQKSAQPVVTWCGVVLTQGASTVLSRSPEGKRTVLVLSGVLTSSGCLDSSVFDLAPVEIGSSVGFHFNWRNGAGSDMMELYSSLRTIVEYVYV